MGRITMFTIDDCPHCSRVKAEMKKRSIPITEISLSLYPPRRNDMLSLSDRLEVPQVFLNELHIGGAKETLDMLRKWDRDSSRSPKETYDLLVARGQDPKDPRLDPPTTPPVEPKLPPPRTEYHCVGTPSGTRVSVLEITETLRNVLPRSNLKYNLTSYKNCFTGKSGVEAVAAHYSVSERVAEEFLLYLQQEHQILDHVVGDHAFSGSESLYFRLQCYQTPNVLNSYRVWKERVDPDTIGLLERLKKMISKLESDSKDKNGKINYKVAASLETFHTFEEAVCEVQGVKMAQMAYEAKLAFCINLYNLMIKYAFMKVGVGTTDVSRMSFFSSVMINIGGELFSFQDIENGILRGNRKAPYALQKPFRDKDMRIRHSMPKVDERIHFALNCGAASCPPVKDFRGDSIDEELRIVSQAFCEDDSQVSIDTSARTIQLSMIFNWYKDDFIGNSGKNSDFAAALLPYLRGAKRQALQLALNSGTKFKVSFIPYDWSCNGSDFEVFSGGQIRANSSRFS